VALAQEAFAWEHLLLFEIVVRLELDLHQLRIDHWDLMLALWMYLTLKGRQEWGARCFGYDIFSVCDVSLAGMCQFHLGLLEGGEAYQ